MKLTSARGNEVRSRSQRRFHVVVDYGQNRGAFVSRRSDNVDTAKKERNRHGVEYLTDSEGRFLKDSTGRHISVPNAVVVDTVTGAVV